MESGHTFADTLLVGQFDHTVAFGAFLVLCPLFVIVVAGFPQRPLGCFPEHPHQLSLWHL